MLLAVVVVAAQWEIFRLGFFADDFHFLDVGLRPFGLDLLLGRDGIHPWYRPLSRELPFLALARAGAAGPFVAHLLTLAALAAATWALDRLGRRWLDPRVARIPALLLAVSGVSKFLAGWASGLQDLLAIALLLHASLALAEGHGRRALVLAALASFAKETGVLAFPILLLQALLVEPRRPSRRFLVGGGLAAAAVLAVHAAVRSTWPSAMPSGIGSGGAPAAELGAAVRFMGSWFVPLGTGPLGGAIVSAAVAGVAAGWLTRRASEDAEPSGWARPPGRALAVFLLAATALAASLLAIAAVTSWSRPHGYYAFAAFPWALLALGLVLSKAGGLPRSRALPALVGLLVAGHVWSAGFRAPDLERAEAWSFRRWDWNEAVRLSATSRQMAGDLRQALQGNRDDAIVLYNTMPLGSMFQTQDGPATRCALGRRALRAYYLGEATVALPLERIVMLRFDRTSLRLVPEARDFEASAGNAMAELLEEHPGAAWAWTAWVPDGNRDDPDLAYLRAAARLLDGGPAPFAATLAGAGLDSTGPGVTRFVRDVFAGDATLGAAGERMLRNPTSGAAHAGLAEQLLRGGAEFSGALEFQLALALDPARSDWHLRLGTLHARAGRDAMARRCLDRALATAHDPLTRQAAQAALATSVRGRGP